MSQQKQAKLFCQIFAKFEYCWHKDGHDDKVQLLSTSPNLCQRTTVWHRCSKLLHNAELLS